MLNGKNNPFGEMAIAKVRRIVNDPRLNAFYNAGYIGGAEKAAALSLLQALGNCLLFLADPRKLTVFQSAYKGIMPQIIEAGSECMLRFVDTAMVMDGDSAEDLVTSYLNCAAALLFIHKKMMESEEKRSESRQGKELFLRYFRCYRRGLVRLEKWKGEILIQPFYQADEVARVINLWFADAADVNPEGCRDFLWPNQNTA